MKLSALKVDAAKIEGGEWVENIPEAGDLRLRVRGLNNAAYRRLQAKLNAAVPRGTRGRDGALGPTDADRILARLLAETVLLDWDGLEGPDGAPVPFSVEQAHAYLSDPNYRPFREAVLAAAARVGNDEAEAEAADLGNSSRT